MSIFGNKMKKARAIEIEKSRGCQNRKCVIASPKKKKKEMMKAKYLERRVGGIAID